MSVEVKIWWKGDKLRKCLEWHEEQGIFPDMGPNIKYKDMVEIACKPMNGFMCDVFYFEDPTKAMMFKLTFGGDRV